MTSRHIIATLVLVALVPGGWLLPRIAAAGTRHHHAWRAPDTSAMQKTHREIRLDGSLPVSLTLEFDAGSLRVTRGDRPGVVTMDLYQTADADSPRIEFDSSRDSQRLSVKSGDWKWGEHGDLSISVDRSTTHDDDADTSDDNDDRDDTADHGRHAHRDHGPRRVWEIALPPDTRFDVELASGASHNELDFSGLRLHDLHLATGAGEMELRFDSPNPDPGGTLNIEGGACELSAYGLGNARFRSIQFQGGVGDFLLDFRGKASGDTRGELTMGLGKLRLELPSSIGVKLDCSGGALSHLDVDGLIRHGDTYRSEDYDGARNHLVLELSASLGLVEVAVED